MNIIIVGKAHSVPKRIDLDSTRGRVMAAGILGAAALILLGAGFAAAMLFSGSKARDLREIANLRASIVAQRDQLAGLDQDSHRDLDALALQLGLLQAQATRLNALGDRLTQVGKLDDGEFDFGSDPALGGPEEPATGAGAPLPLSTGIDNLRAEFNRQEAQLGVLENLLLDRKIDNALLPSGMPVAQGYIASGFGERSDPINGHQAIHLGIDFDAPMGTPVTAVAEGVVTFIGVKPGYGNVVEIDHGNGYMTRYAHNSALVAQAGARVHAGETIAKVGSTGRSTGPHCHFEVWLNGRPVNPIAYVKSKRAPKA
jgi:murein DD-endopeptidase MepM/ murein hydrolase activator NlpD